MCAQARHKYAKVSYKIYIYKKSGFIVEQMEMKQYNQFELEEGEEFQSDLGTSSSNYRQYLIIADT